MKYNLNKGLQRGKTRLQKFSIGLTALLSTAMLAVSGGGAFAAPTVVTPSNMGSWAEDSTPPADVQFVNGPATPPLGSGSAQFTVDSSGATDAELRNDAYDALKLSDITKLQYSTYVQSNNSEQAVYIMLNVDYDGDGLTDDQLFFEPVYQDSTFCANDQGDVVTGTWQDWDALNGCWWSVNGTAGAGPGTDTKTLAQIIAAEPNAAIATSVSPKGAIRLTAGFGGPTDWGNFNGNADAFMINSDTYDFELQALPTSPTNKDQCKNGGWQSFGGVFKNQGDCVSFVATKGKNKPSNGSF